MSGADIRHFPADLLYDHVRSAYASAREDERAAGLYWYSAAHTYARGLADRYLEGDVRAAAGILAALSPQLSWDLNCAYAELLCATGDAPTLRLSADKARRILNGEVPEKVLAPPNPRRPTGEKSRAFFANIAEPWTAGPVTIDRHAAAAATEAVSGARHGSYLYDLDLKGAYDHVANAYRRTADDHGIRPHECQAVVWLWWRRVKGLDWREAMSNDF